MNAFNAADATLPGFDSLLNSLINASWYQARQNATQGAIQRGTGYQVLHRLMALSLDLAATPQVRAQSLVAIQDLGKWLAAQTSERKKKTGSLDKDWAAHYALAQQEIRLWLADPQRLAPIQKRSAPPGSPIGD